MPSTSPPITSDSWKTENVVYRAVVWLRNQPLRVLSNLGLVAVLALVVLVGGLNQHRVDSASPQLNNGLSAPTSQNETVDPIATVYIAANVATQLELPIATQVNEQVNKLNSTAEMGTDEAGGLSSKPTVVETPGATNQQIETYTVKEGDTLESVAAKYGVNTDTIIWANGINSATEVVPNMELRILPVNGVLHTVKEGENLETIATQYQAQAHTIINFNDLEVSGLTPGREIVVPGGVKAVAVVQSRPAVFDQAFSPSFNGNGYDYGWCTWHAANRRAEIGRPIPSNWGNAISWRYNAAASGYRIGTTPAAGAVAWHKNIGGWGHVAFVERVTEDGAWLSDMNYPTWGQVTHRFVAASEYGNYNFIY